MRSPAQLLWNQQAKLFKYWWANPTASLGQALTDLNLKTYDAAKKVSERLKGRLNLPITCPNCFEERLTAGVCGNCSFRPDAPNVRLDTASDEQSQVRELVERELASPLAMDCIADVLRWLMPYQPGPGVSARVGPLVAKDLLEMRERWGSLLASEGMRAQVVARVKARLRLVHRSLRGRPTAAAEMGGEALVMSMEGGGESGKADEDEGEYVLIRRSELAKIRETLESVKALLLEL